MEHSLLVVGLGDSFAVVKAITPLDVQCETKLLHQSKVLLVSASGNNSDTVGVYEYEYIKLYETYKT